jgi:elongation factor Ts
MTGAGMMACKRALVDTGGDVEAAQTLLREKGIAAAGKRAERETTEGLVLARVDGTRGTMVAVGCETEPVSKNADFRSFAEQVLEVASTQGPGALGTLEDERVALVAKLGENIAVRGAAQYTAAAGEVVHAYIHPPAHKIGVLVRIKATPELAKLLAMHISFANPSYLTRDGVPQSAVDDERAIYEKLPDVEGKPEDVRTKIVEGMLQKRFFAESVLVDQAWIHEPSLSVGRALAEHSAEIREFERFALTG